MYNVYIKNLSILNRIFIWYVLYKFILRLGRLILGWVGWVDWCEDILFWVLFCDGR